MEGSPQAHFGRPAEYTGHRFSFSGNAKEYFGIWIVNVLLTIVTLGIYSAWAKVRRNRYFYGNTALADGRFDYHARPKQILIGRILVVGYLIVYNILLNFAPIVGLVLALLFLIAIPWLIARGLRFSARVTSYRNVRFDFVGGYWGAVRAFFLSSIVAGLSLGILAPFASRWTLRYTLGNLRYGGKVFSPDPTIGSLYRVWILPAVLTVVGLVLFGILIAGASAGLETMKEEASTGEVAFILVLYLLFVPILLIYAVTGLLYSAGVRNAGFSATTFDDRHYLYSDMPRWGYAWVVISNLVVTVLTLGLMRPWAAVRLARYHAVYTAIVFDGDVGEIFSDIKDSGSAVGSEFMDIEGIDFGF
ncbi:YjgN family protein [Phyllobacterium myrsinacearum]|uniref:Uncharacterized membrane protein YjgN (DUF898 family) n=1 Tax=Phyllobacterium myrsinacearum TaxID=28101 RepID=A0A839EJS0_9HYPH|nr:DUF898 family protein [Phyllobacterium myrsinacearum]MBA8880251.1 uncharacterized membrane protein YjgN (DUF898 family) [Phyllobacterium myrsinacearum]